MSRIALHFLLALAVFANGLMLSTAGISEHKHSTAIHSHNDVHIDAEVHQHPAAEYQHAKSDTSKHHHDGIVENTCNSKACQDNCDCGCGMGFCMTSAANLLLNQSLTFSLQSSDNLPSQRIRVIVSARSATPLRPPIV